MILVKIDALDRYAFIVYNFVKKIVGFVMRIVLYVIHTLASFMMPDSDTDQIRVVMDALEEGDSNIVLRILSAIVYFVGLAAVLYVLVRIFIALIRLIPMSRNLTPQVIEESDMVEIRERIVKTEEESREKLDKVRRRYKKTVEKEAELASLQEKGESLPQNRGRGRPLGSKNKKTIEREAAETNPSKKHGCPIELQKQDDS